MSGTVVKVTALSELETHTDTFVYALSGTVALMDSKKATVLVNMVTRQEAKKT